MKEWKILAGTYEEVKNWYNSLEINERKDNTIYESGKLYEFKPFEEQFSENDEIGKIKMIAYFEYIKKENETILNLKVHKVCRLLEFKDE